MPGDEDYDGGSVESAVSLVEVPGGISVPETVHGLGDRLQRSKSVSISVAGRRALATEGDLFGCSVSPTPFYVQLNGKCYPIFRAPNGKDVNYVFFGGKVLAFRGKPLKGAARLESLPDNMIEAMMWDGRGDDIIWPHKIVPGYNNPY